MPVASLIILGSGSGRVTSGRACSGYLVDFDQSLTMLDCGSGVVRSFLRSGYDLESLDRVIISHTHPDHVTDLPLLIQNLHLAGRNEPLDVFLPSEFVNPLRLLLNASYIIPDRFKFELRLHEIEAGKMFTGPISAEAISNAHLQKYDADIQRLGLANRMQSYSLLIKTVGAGILYSSDITGLHEIEHWLVSCTHALIESTHVNMSDCVSFARQHGTTTFILTHLGDDTEVEALREMIAGSANMQIAEDGLRIDIETS